MNSQAVNPKGEGKKVVLRCFVYKNKDKFIAIALELGLAAEGKTPEEAKRRIHEAIVAYFDAVSTCQKNGERVIFRRVPYYWCKRFGFEAATLAYRMFIKYQKRIQKRIGKWLGSCGYPRPFKVEMMVAIS